MSQYGHILTLITAWLVIPGCAGPLPPSSSTPHDYEWTAIDLTIQAWLEQGLPWDNRCTEEFPKVKIVVSEPEEFTDICGRAPVGAGGKLYACNTERYEWSFPFWFVNDDRIPLLVISTLQPEHHQRMLVIHEALHWLERCSGKGIDFEHEDKRVWVSAKFAAQDRYVQVTTRQEQCLALDDGAIEWPQDLGPLPTPVVSYEHWSPSEDSAGNQSTAVGTTPGATHPEVVQGVYTPAWVAVDDGN